MNNDTIAAADQGQASEQRLTRGLVDRFGLAEAAEFLGMHHITVTRIASGLPVPHAITELCRVRLAEVGEAMHDAISDIEGQSEPEPEPEPEPLSPDALHGMGSGFIRNLGASVIASEARALGNDDSAPNTFLRPPKEWK